MTETVTNAAPRGGLARMSRRVMNLAHMLTQNARRHGDRTGFIWGDRSWTWREIDAPGLGAGGGAGGARHRQGRPHPGPFQELRRDVLVDVRGVPARRGLGADQFPPDAGRGRLSRDRLRREGLPVPRRFPRSCRGRRGEARARIHLADRRGRASARQSVSEVDRRAMRARAVENAAVEYDDPCWFFFTSGTTGRSKAAVLTHGQMAFVVTNHLADLMPGTTETDASLVVAPLVARRRRAPARCRSRAACRPSCCRPSGSTSTRRSG